MGKKRKWALALAALSLAAAFACMAFGSAGAAGQEKEELQKTALYMEGHEPSFAAELEQDGVWYTLVSVEHTAAGSVDGLSMATAHYEEE